MGQQSFNLETYHVVQYSTVQYCSRHGFTYIRKWMQMVLAPNDLFSWNNNTMRHSAYDRYLHYCWSMHNDTYSVHDRSLRPWWGRLPLFQPSCYVFSPPLSRVNWSSLSPTGVPGPPSPKVASLPLGSAHTPFPGSRTSTVHAFYVDSSSRPRLIYTKFHILLLYSMTRNFKQFLEFCYPDKT
jgi:hypothetical protein